MQQNRVKRSMNQAGFPLGPHALALPHPPIYEHCARADVFRTRPPLAHLASSTRAILLACMTEHREAVERLEEIAAVPGVDLLAVGPSDLSRSLGVSGHPDHPRLVAAIDRIRAAVKNGAGCPLALPLNHAAFPRNAAQPKELGPRYSKCAPTPPAPPLRS